MFNPFSRAPRGGVAWFNAGPVVSYPNIETADSALAQQRLCNDAYLPGCKVFHVPKEDATQASPVAIDDWKDGEGDTKDQVMIFRYNGKFVAVNHECPHSSYPLSNGTPFDIEDFGVKLSGGITCPKHDWSFDLFTGRSDRGSYKLTVWETQLRK
ncbi:rieske domain-containing protein, partial [Macroventuria anomochaeta]